MPNKARRCYLSFKYLVLQAVKDGVGSEGKANGKAGGGDGDSDGEGEANATHFLSLLFRVLAKSYWLS